MGMEGQESRGTLSETKQHAARKRIKFQVDEAVGQDRSWAVRSTPVIITRDGNLTANQGSVWPLEMVRKKINYLRGLVAKYALLKGRYLGLDAQIQVQVRVISLWARRVSRMTRQVRT